MRLVSLLLALLASAAVAFAAPDSLAEAQHALFVASDSARARQLADSALAASDLPSDHRIAALFVAMEAAALQADSPAVLEAATRILELGATRDPHGLVAAGRIQDLAGNTPEFARVSSRVLALARQRSAVQAYLYGALLTAAGDGLEGASLRQIAREAGVPVVWEIAGPFGTHPNLDFDRGWPPEQGRLKTGFNARPTERFEFPDGVVGLPDYFDRGGVYYAAADIQLPAAGWWELRIESGGTLEASFDGVVAIRKDERFVAGPSIVTRKLRLPAGAHRLLVKLLPSASPFRVFVRPASDVEPGATAPDTAEAAYLRAAESFWTGDAAGAIDELQSAKRPAVAALLLVQAWSRQEAGPEERTYLAEAMKRDYQALAAELQLARLDWENGLGDETLKRVRRVRAARPDSITAAELEAEILAAGKRPEEAAAAFTRLTELDHSCGTWNRAMRFYSSASRVAEALGAREHLRGCAPASLDYAQALAEAGEHVEAAKAAASVVAAFPFDRGARALLAEELLRAGDPAAASATAAKLRELAPNSSRFAALAEHISRGSLAPVETPQAAAFAKQEFYAPFRRDGAEIMLRTADRQFTGGRAVVLLNERIVRLETNGAASVYAHRLTRLLNREGIEQYGEVSLPPGAQLVELRTLKSDGRISEPELHPGKPPVSMTGLAPGDAIDLEYIMRFASIAEADDSADEFRMPFGSFAAPVLDTRLMLIEPAGAPPMQVVATTPMEPEARTIGADRVRIWQRTDIPQSIAEPGMIAQELALPVVRVLTGARTWEEVRAKVLEAAVVAMRIGPRLRGFVTGLHGSDEAKARALYHRVQERVRTSSSDFMSGEITAAEESVSTGEGSRTAVLLAAARAAGLDAELLLARDASAASATPSPLLYTRPLVRFHFAGGGTAVVDAESEALAFGQLPPTLDRSGTMRIAVSAAPEPSALPRAGAEERSRAEADVALASDGSLTARLEITLGRWRSTQMRTRLRAITGDARRPFFDQMALRIFSGAQVTATEVRNEDNPDQPLLLVIECRAPRFVALSDRSTVDQIAPALGLRRMYGGGADRRFPLLVETPLVEITRFRVRLPAGYRLGDRPPETSLQSQFGSYSLHIRPLGDRWEIERAFDIPAQLVSTGDYPEFSRFADRIEQTERQRLTLVRERAAAVQVR